MALIDNLRRPRENAVNIHRWSDFVWLMDIGLVLLGTGIVGVAIFGDAMIQNVAPRIIVVALATIAFLILYIIRLHQERGQPMRLKAKKMKSGGYLVEGALGSDESDEILAFMRPAKQQLYGTVILETADGAIPRMCYPALLRNRDFGEMTPKQFEAEVTGIRIDVPLQSAARSLTPGPRRVLPPVSRGAGRALPRESLLTRFKNDRARVAREKLLQQGDAAPRAEEGAGAERKDPAASDAMADDANRANREEVPAPRAEESADVERKDPAASNAMSDDVIRANRGEVPVAPAGANATRRLEADGARTRHEAAAQALKMFKEA